jgi:protocatechuate 3,4-dioxygenase beta subunit
VNDWRPAHIHFSVFGTDFAQRLITQMYFEGDPLIAHDAILGTIPDLAARERLVARLDLGAALPLHTLATAGTSSRAAIAPRCSRTSCRGTKAMITSDALG